jgi:PAS domain S-box-containing protein
MNIPEGMIPLRSAAEDRLALQSEPILERSAEELQHELQVHQIELEMQNEALRHAQEALEESRDHYVSLYEFAPVGYLTLSPAGAITGANLTAAGQLGTERAKLIGKKFSSLVAEEDLNRYQLVFASTLDKRQRHSCELMLRHGFSMFFPAHLDWLYLESPSEAGALRVTLTDITELKRAEDDIRRLNDRLQASNHELESFSYSVSHDLRAPLRALNGFSQILAERYADRLDETGVQYLNRIRAASDRMAKLIDDLIDLALINRQELKRVQVDVSAMAEEILHELADENTARKVDWQVTPELRVQGDKVLVKALLRNLLRNAWKFTSEQAHAHIELGHADLPEGEAFFVRDNGVGFDMAYANSLFKPFQRLHGAERFEGTGIGLAFVHRIAIRHGGRVWAEGNPGEGATFWFML